MSEDDDVEELREYSEEGQDDYQDVVKQRDGMPEEEYDEDRDDWRDATTHKQTRRDGILLSLSGFALLVFIEAILSKGAKFRTAAIIMGVISLLLTVPKFVLNVLMDKRFSEMIEILFGVALLILWSTGVVALTFNNGVFFTPGTGYFSTWFNLILSGYYIFLNARISNIRQIQKNKEITEGKDADKISYKRGASPVLAAIWFTSLAVLTQSIIALNNDVEVARAKYGISAGVFSLLIIILMLTFSVKTFGGWLNYFYMAIILLGIWTVVVLSCTMTDPFLFKFDLGGGLSTSAVVANGFYASLGSFVGSMMLVYKCHLNILLYEASIHSKKTTRLLYMTFLMLTSFLVFVQGIQECNDIKSCNRNRFNTAGIVLGFISFFLASVTMWFLRPSQHTTEYVMEQVPVSTFEVGVGFVLVFLWTASSIALTFPSRSPFYETSTGYFAIWSSFILSIIYLSAAFPDNSKVNNKLKQYCIDFHAPNGQPPESNYGMIVSVIGIFVQLAASVTTCIEGLNCKDDDIFVYVISLLSLVILAILLVRPPDKLGHLALLLILFYVVLWYAGVAVITLKGPFVDAAGNGFYAGWAVLFGGVYTLRSYKFQLGSLDSND